MIQSTQTFISIALLLFIQIAILSMVSASSSTTSTTSAPKTAESASAKSSSKDEIPDQTFDRYINNERYMLMQYECLMGNKPCDHVGRKLKAAVPLVVRGLGCPKCSQREEDQMKRIVSHVQRSYPDKWQKLIKKYGN
ncbi:ejaculatory bulb-specific protein 3 [Nilaparvata lugens]|uniref:ejaculatory bulb-specific protein 3 n=1 Tax=Nilaparvata lugens TaxID=108931 RepID=UPI000B97CFD0|nr:ejaculatory bulb-specific protein 3 [Nilaparvata lugens]